MRTIFIADAHLVSPNDSNYRNLCSFLKDLNGNCQTLYILGDLFDFWLGFPCNTIAAQHEPLLETLEALIKSGCRLVYFEGNHDFHLGEVFAKRLDTEIHTKPAIKSIQNRRIYLCHGDQLNSDDYGYRFLRFLLHNRMMSLAVKFVPLSLAIKIRNRLQRVSRSGYESKNAKWDYAEIIRSAAKKLQKQGVEGLVTGHFHIRMCEHIDNTGFQILSLPDCIGGIVYGEIVDGKFSINHYQQAHLSKNSSNA